MRPLYISHLIKDGVSVGSLVPQDFIEDALSLAETCGVEFDHVEMEVVYVIGDTITKQGAEPKSQPVADTTIPVGADTTTTGGGE